MNSNTFVKTARLPVRSLLLASLLFAGCSYNPDDSEKTVLTSGNLFVQSYQSASTTLATSYRRTVDPGDSIKLVSYVYDSDLMEPVAAGVVEFSARLEIDDGTVIDEAIGQASIVDGRAEIVWKTSTEFFGIYSVRATFNGDDNLSPSQWQFAQHVARPNDEGALAYTMVRLNHLVNLMTSPTTLGSVFEDGPDENLADVLMAEFGLGIVNDYSYYRLESFEETEIGFKDTTTFLESLGRNDTKFVDLCVRTSLFVAANDDVLVIIIKGTDGGPNEDVNEEGSPSSHSNYANNIAVHPGWAWMSAKMVNGFSNWRCGEDAYRNSVFPGLRRIIEDNRIAPDGTIRRVYISGHSLGGAIARMAAVKMVNGPLMRKDRVYTFGAPWQNAYNTLFGFDDFRSYAGNRFRDNGIREFRAEGNNDPIPSITERATNRAWYSSTSGLKYYAVTVIRAAKCAVDEVKSWFGAGDGCEDDVVDRPIGYNSPDLRTRFGFTSLNHRRLYMDGTPAIERCYETLVDDVLEIECKTAQKTQCLATDVSCTPLYHKTDVGDFSVIQSRAHWVGDYEFDAKTKLRGDPTRYNFYFPDSTGGRIRMPLEVLALP